MERLQLRARVYQRDARDFSAEVERFDHRARRRRALARALPLLGGALLSLPIPGWHFIGVPGFVIAAVMLGRRRLAQELRVVSLAGDCPACGEALVFDSPPLERLPATLPCPSCREFLQLEELR